ncbi:MAG: methyltransferase [Tannerellaceae bacterium]|jgi:tRNA1Val (adenine37-N6)-methyltransferase|nr:methyltransferase [Tannerellaceae bacterium]
MKVGTDGVTLGAWADVDGCSSILDVGTGSGLIALMLAQRNQQAIIDAIDIDAEACSQAGENFAASPFGSRLGIIHEPLSSFAERCGKRYDMIVSNPPYFINSLKSPNSRRNTARHTDMLPLEELVSAGKRLLEPSGRLALILPIERERDIRGAAVGNCLNVVRVARLMPREGREAKRLLMELSDVKDYLCKEEEITVLAADGKFTDDYAALTASFYL